MVAIDYIFIFFTVTVSLMGMLRGFVSQLFSLASWSIFVYVLFYHFQYFTDIISSEISLDYNYIRIITVSLLTIFTITFIFILNLPTKILKYFSHLKDRRDYERAKVDIEIMEEFIKEYDKAVKLQHEWIDKTILPMLNKDKKNNEKYH